MIPRSGKVREFRAPSEQVAPPLLSSWASLSTIAVLAPGFASTWGDRDELRMCPFCGTYYEYRQVYNSGDVLEAETTDWYLKGMTPYRAAALLDRAQPPQTGSEPGNVERHFPHILQTSPDLASNGSGSGPTQTTRTGLCFDWHVELRMLDPKRNEVRRFRPRVCLSSKAKMGTT
jgi:hypothetical protein